MTLLPLAIPLLLHIPFVCSSLLSLNGSSVTTLDVSTSSSCIHTRTLWDIIWSCAATLFACTWTAIHPNVPGMDEGKFTILCRRLGIMMMALIAPELMIIWATMQFLSARDTAKDFDDAFGAQIHQARSDHSDTGESTATLLGEIPISDGRSASHAASRNFRGRLPAWLFGVVTNFIQQMSRRVDSDTFHEGSMEIPIIAEADIEDRSKGDVLSKGIAILQLAWFVLQFVTRCIQNLPITLLEVDTLAVATLTCITYSLWWKKPKDARRPYAVHWKATYPPSKLTYDNVTAHLSCKVWHDYVFFVIYPWGSLHGSWRVHFSSCCPRTSGSVSRWL
ncbi:hypothetical protein F4604DRAFT_1954068 [Suillus subluteus]|nr:hypothetical protein F4604DRAFT_1954068 [Suillus subluteus]